MRDETIRFVTSALAIGIGLVFVASGLTLMNMGTDIDPAYTRAGMLLLPAGLLTIAVAIRWQLPVLLSRIVLDRRAKLILVFLGAVVLLFSGSLFLSRWDAVGGLAGLLFGLEFLAVFLRMVSTSRRPLSARDSEALKRELQRTSLRPLGITVLAALMAADGTFSIVMTVFLAMVEAGYYPRAPSILLPTILLFLFFLFFGFLKAAIGFGLSNGSRWSWAAAVFYNSLYLVLSTFAIVLWPFLFVFQIGALGLVIFLSPGLAVPVVVLSIALSVFTLYYLDRVHVKTFFEKVGMYGTLRRSYP